MFLCEIAPLYVSLQEKKILQFFQTKSTTRKTSYHIQTWVISPLFQLFICHYIQPWEILSKAMNAAFPISKFQQFFIGYPDSITLYCFLKFHSHLVGAAGCHFSSSIWFIFFQIIWLIYLVFWFRKWVALLFLSCAWDVGYLVLPCCGLLACWAFLYRISFLSLGCTVCYRWPVYLVTLPRCVFHYVEVNLVHFVLLAVLPFGINKKLISKKKMVFVSLF